MICRAHALCRTVPLWPELSLPVTQLFFTLRFYNTEIRGGSARRRQQKKLSRRSKRYTIIKQPYVKKLHTPNLPPHTRARRSPQRRRHTCAFLWRFPADFIANPTFLPSPLQKQSKIKTRTINQKMTPTTNHSTKYSSTPTSSTLDPRTPRQHHWSPPRPRRSHCFAALVNAFALSISESTSLLSSTTQQWHQPKDSAAAGLATAAAATPIYGFDEGPALIMATTAMADAASMAVAEGK